MANIYDFIFSSVKKQTKTSGFWDQKLSTGMFRMERALKVQKEEM